MPSTVASIIFDGYRESNLISIYDTLDDQQTAEGFRRLQVIVAAVLGWDVGENLQDWPIGVLNVKRDHWPTPIPNYNYWTQNTWQYPLQNMRLLLDHEEAQTIYLPQQPDNGARFEIVRVSQDLATHPITLDANGRKIEGATTLVLNDNATANRTIMYDSARAEWVRVIPLVEDGDMPFPIEFDFFFITKLAMRLNPAYGRALTAESSAALEEAQSQLNARYRNKQAEPADPAVLRLTDPGRLGYIRAGGRYGWMS
jgi:hypothetical protein